MQDGLIHFGLSLAEYKAVVEDIPNNEIMWRWAEDSIRVHQVTFASRNYQTLIAAPEMFEVTDSGEIDDYRSKVDGLIRELTGDVSSDNE